MDSKKSQKSKLIKWVVGLLMLATVLMLIFKTSLPKKFIEYVNQDLKTKNKDLQKEIDSIRSLQKNDSLFYENLIKDLQKEKTKIIIQRDNANYKLLQYEKAFKNYNSGDFYPNFIIFSNFVTSSDTIPNIR